MPERAAATGVAPIRVRLASSFTTEGACALRLLAKRFPPGTPIEVDFAGVRDCQEVALLLLARQRASGAGALSFRGLSAHQRIVLGYLGVPLPAPAESDAD
jgi:hypothetical protein